MRNPLLQLPLNSFKATLEGSRAEVFRNLREVTVFDMWVNMVHNRHNMLESRSLSGRGDGDNINPQDFKEILGTTLISI